MIAEADREHLIRGALAGYRRHVDWEDLLQVARIACWRFETSGRGEGLQPSTWIYHAARWAAGEYLRSGQGMCLGRRCSSRRREGPFLFSYNALAAAFSGESLRRMPIAEQRRLLEIFAQPDFAPRLIERIGGRQEAAALWARLMALATPRQRDYLQARFVDGLSWGTIAARFGVTETAPLLGCQWAISRLRTELGLPEGPMGPAANRERCRQRSRSVKSQPSP